MLNTTVSHYRIVEHLGGGGMGVVYKAEDTKLGRTVALKFLPPEWSRDPDARERFLREARAASALEDSRICTIHDIDETDDGRLFIAMAYYEGESLKKRLESGRLPIGEAVEIAIQVAEGLESAHSAEILHRDIKPANLMLTGHDEVVIVDFGLAKLAGDFTLTKPGSSLGTPHYMSPEQSRGQDLDERTDLWSLGVVLYEMLTGERPFAGENHTSVARAILDDDVPEIKQLRPEAPPELGAIVNKALIKDANRRYQNAGELLADLRGLKNQISEFEGLTLSAPSQTPRKRRPLLPLVLIVVAVVLGTAVVLWYLGPGGADKPADTPRPRIVVLPFENLGPPEDEYFADGMTEEIISRLSAVSGLSVISRTSAMHYKRSNKTIRQIGEELRVQYILEGTVRWERPGGGHGRVRVTPQLIDVADDTHLWSDRYDRAMESVFELQSDIAGQVVNQLHISLFERELEALNTRPTDSPEAYAAYLSGMRYSQTSNSFDEMELSIAMFERAVELDSGFALAWARLSTRHAYFFFAFLPTSDHENAAKKAAETALALDPALPDGNLAMGYYYYYCLKDYDRALEFFDRTLATRPNDPRALKGRGHVLRRIGRWQESTSLYERVFENDPADSDLAVNLSGSYQYLRDFQKADEYIDVAISLAPDRMDSRLQKFEITFRSGRIDEARELLRAAPVGMRRFEIAGIELEIAGRRFREALNKLDETPQTVYDQVLGEVVAGYLPALYQCSSLFFLGDQHGVQNACGRALIDLEAAVSRYPDQWAFRSRLGQTYAFLGRKDEAIREGKLAVSKFSDDALKVPTHIQRLAWIYVHVGELDEAMDQLEHLLSNPGLLTVNWLRLHPAWDPLRDHPRFQALLEEYDTE